MVRCIHKDKTLLSILVTCQPSLLSSPEDICTLQEPPPAAPGQQLQAGDVPEPVPEVPVQFQQQDPVQHLQPGPATDPVPAAHRGFSDSIPNVIYHALGFQLVV